MYIFIFAFSYLNQPLPIISINIYLPTNINLFYCFNTFMHSSTYTHISLIFPRQAILSACLIQFQALVYPDKNSRECKYAAVSLSVPDLLFCSQYHFKVALVIFLILTMQFLESPFLSVILHNPAVFI